ncbi:MAG: hypothetical protein JO297_08510 [Nitrososphaeraceae archaeon]|nr:hypothetical protein [Nitrososphaeraceae archaeon]
MGTILLSIAIILLISKSFSFETLDFNFKNVWAQTSDYNNNVATTSTSNQIADIISTAVDTATANITKNDINQTLSQISLLTEAKAGKDNAQQFLSQIAAQVASNPKGSVAQSLIRLAQEHEQEHTLLNQTISAALTSNIPIPSTIISVALSTINGTTENTIDTISKYLASSTGISKEAYQDVLQQLALSISNTDGKEKADKLISQQLPIAIVQQDSRQIIQPLSAFAWDQQYGRFDTLDQGMSDITTDILNGNSLQSSLVVIPFPSGGIYDSGGGSGISSGSTIEPPPFQDNPSYQQQTSSSPLTPQQDLRSMDSGGGGGSLSSSSDQGQPTPQQDLRSMDSGGGEASSDQGTASGGDSSTPQQDLRSMDSGTDNSVPSNINNDQGGDPDSSLP